MMGRVIAILKQMTRGQFCWSRVFVLPRVIALPRVFAFCVVAALMVPMVAGLPVTAHAKEVSAKTKQAIDAIQADSAYQTEFDPMPKPPRIDPPPARSNWFSNFLEWLLGPGQVLATILVVLAGLFVVGLILYLTVPAVRNAIDNWRGRRRLATVDDEILVWQPDETLARNLVNDADALAREGRFAEAARLLLTRSVDDISTRRPGAVKPALTARAIGRLPELPEQARSAFGRLTDIVESGIWARNPLNEQDWQNARAAFESFAFGPQWRAV